MRGNRVNRRSFLQALAGGCVALPLLEAGQAQAQAAAPRLVIYQTGQGNLSTWTPPVLNGNALQLSTMLEPLAPHQDKVMALSGVSNLVSPLHNSDGHIANTKTLLTANVMDTTESGAFDANVEAHPSQMSMGPSIDHYLAAQLGLQTPLNLAVGMTDNFAAMSHQAEQNANGTHSVAPLLGDPREVFQTYFAGQSSNNETTRADRFRQSRGRALQGVSEAFGALRTSLGQRDRQRIEQHLDAIADLENELGFVPPANCGEVTVDIPTGYEAPSWPDYNNMDVTADLMTTLATQALACNAKQVVTIHDTHSHAPGFEFLGMGAVEGWHAHVHNDPALGLGYASSAENPILQAGFRYYAEVFNNLLAKMDAIVEPNGGTLLDNSIVVWISELGAGTNHHATELPIVIAGGAGRIAMNRHIASPEGTSTNDFFLSLLHAYGVMDSSFGHTGAAGLNNGPIAGLVS
jgi:Protein of unknown function (DUF1552)